MDSRGSKDYGRDGGDCSHIPAHIRKYWAQRYSLFNRFDDGIQLDEESWYSVTPERIAKNIAKRFKGYDVVGNPFSGPGGSCIQLALNGSKVVAVESCAHRIVLAKNNATVYGVRQKIEFIHADAYDAMNSLAVDNNGIQAIFMSPPWGGPGYLNEVRYDVLRFRKAIEGALAVTKNVAVLIPRNVNDEDVKRIYGRDCEVEPHFHGFKLKAKCIFFGDLRCEQFKHECSHKFEIKSHRNVDFENIGLERRRNVNQDSSRNGYPSTCSKINRGYWGGQYIKPATNPIQNWNSSRLRLCKNYKDAYKPEQSSIKAKPIGEFNDERFHKSYQRYQHRHICGIPEHLGPTVPSRRTRKSWSTLRT